MEKQAVQLALKLKMAEFEAEATARAETIQDLQSELFDAQKKIDQAQKDAEARVEEVRRTAEAALFGLESEMQRGSDEDSDWEPGDFGSRPDTGFSDGGLPAIGGERAPSTASSRTSGGTRKGWSALVHGAEVDPDVAASNAAVKMQKKMDLRARQAEQKAELARVRCTVTVLFHVTASSLWPRRLSRLSLVSHGFASGREKAWQD